jgi:hypothetical protein
MHQNDVSADVVFQPRDELGQPLLRGVRVAQPEERSRRRRSAHQTHYTSAPHVGKLEKIGKDLLKLDAGITCTFPPEDLECLSRVARFILTQYTKTRENIPNYHNITKWPYNIPNDC